MFPSGHGRLGRALWFVILTLLMGSAALGRLVSKLLGLWIETELYGLVKRQSPRLTGARLKAREVRDGLWSSIAGMG